MLLVYLLICLSPIAFILIALFAIGVAATRTVRMGRRAYQQVKPLVDDLQQKVATAQSKGSSFAERGNNLSSSFEEIAGRWTFIGKALTETTSSPVIRLAEYAGKYAGKSKG